MIGKIIKEEIIIVMGFKYYFQGKYIEVKIEWRDMIKDLKNLKNMVMEEGILMLYEGMEMKDINVSEIDNKERNYKMEIMIYQIVKVEILVLGKMEIELIIKEQKINMVKRMMIK